MRNSYLNFYIINESINQAKNYLQQGDNMDSSALERLIHAEKEWKEALKCSVSKYYSC